MKQNGRRRIERMFHEAITMLLTLMIVLKTHDRLQSHKEAPTNDPSK